VSDRTANGQVKQYSGSGTTWIPLTGANTVASTLAGTTNLLETGNNVYTLLDGQLYMLAANNLGSKQVWQYSGSGTNWTPVTGSNTTVKSIATANDSLYTIANNHMVVNIAV